MPFITREGLRIHWRLDGDPHKPLLVLVNSLGTEMGLWDSVLPGLTRYFRTLRMDKRGHGASDKPLPVVAATSSGPSAAPEVSLETLALDVLAVIDAAGYSKQKVHYCGVSIGGMIGMWLAPRYPERFDRIVLSNTSATPNRGAFGDRIRVVMEQGQAGLVDAVMGRFFTEGFIQRGSASYWSIREQFLQVSPEGYAAACAAIRDMDVESTLPQINHPTLVIASTADQSTPVEHGRAIAGTIPNARYVELPLAHIPHPEIPGQFVDLIVRHLLPEVVPDRDSTHWESGLAKRRASLGASYVDARMTQRSAFTEDFQSFLTRTAWGEVWLRPGFDDRSRRLVLLSTCAATGRWEEFELHTRAAIEGGFEIGDLKEMMMVLAVYASVPSANSAMNRVQKLLADMGRVLAVNSSLSPASPPASAQQPSPKES